MTKLRDLSKKTKKRLFRKYERNVIGNSKENREETGRIGKKKKIKRKTNFTWITKYKRLNDIKVKIIDKIIEVKNLQDKTFEILEK